MATEGLRHSSRIRKPVKTYAEDRAEYDTLPATALPLKQAKTETKPKVKAEMTEDVAWPVTIKHEEDSEDSFAEVEVKPVIVKRRARTDAKSEGQLYGAPPAGTMIPWLEGRMRKQPKVWEVPNRFANSEKYQGSGPDWHANAAEARIARANATLKHLSQGEDEVRAKPSIVDPPEWYHGFLERASTQKMFVLERILGVEENCHANNHDCPYETLEVAGSKGNVYTVTISHLTSCTCPVTVFSRSQEEKQCKHVLYVLHHVLKAPSHLKYQAAFLTAELKELFAHAPALPMQSVHDEPMDGHRKPIDGDCPICFMQFEESDKLVWCRAACGNNLHKQCFDKWAQAKHGVTCPFCRTEWEDEHKTKGQKATIAQVTMPTERGAGGYRNVFDQLAYVD